MTDQLATRPSAGWRGASRATLLAAALAVGLASGANASNASLRTNLNTWSTKLGADARAVGLAARQRHPGRMTNRAIVFRRDALKALTVIRRQRTTTPRALRAKRIAVTALTDYAAAGARWAQSGRARLAHRTTAASLYARRAAAFARAGNRLLVTAGRLLR